MNALRRRATRVVVVGEPALIAETIAQALHAHGLDATSFACSSADDGLELDASGAAVGLVISALEALPDLALIGLLAARNQVPWVVVTTAPRGPVWGAALMLGATLVVGSRVPIILLEDALDHLSRVGHPDSPDLPTALREIWGAAEDERTAAAGRVALLTPAEGRTLAWLRAGCADRPDTDADHRLDDLARKLDVVSTLRPGGQ